jgi:hypothetical protein
MKISRYIPAIIKHGKTFAWATLGYAIIWSAVFGLCFLIDKAVDDTATAQILKLVKYGGYPLLAVGWVIGWVINGAFYVVAHIVLGVLWLIKATFPYCLYFPGIPLALYGLYRIALHLANNPGPTRAELEAEQRHQESMRVVRGAMMLKTLSDMAKK